MVNNVKYTHTGANHIRAKTIFKNGPKNKLGNTSITDSPKEVKKNLNVAKKINNNSLGNNKVVSWIADILNPSNHLPVVGTIKKLHSKAAKSLDAVQSMIGGMLYGGPFGMVKGFGSWIVGKIINKDKIAAKPPKILQNTKKNSDIISSIKNNDNQLIKSRTLSNSERTLPETNIPKTSHKLDLSYNHPTTLVKAKAKILESYSDKKEIKSKALKVSA